MREIYVLLKLFVINTQTLQRVSCLETSVFCTITLVKFATDTRHLSVILKRKKSLLSLLMIIPIGLHVCLGLSTIKKLLVRLQIS